MYDTPAAQLNNIFVRPYTYIYMTDGVETINIYTSISSDHNDFNYAGCIT